MAFFINPKRKKLDTLKSWFGFNFKRAFVSLGFLNIDFSYVNGDLNRIKIGSGCSTTNTIFNTVCGNITIGDDTIFGNNCMVITGRHRFYKGRRAKLIPNSEHYRETPESGYDIEIGNGCFIGSGAIILAPVKIGDDVIIGAGSVITKDIPSGCFVAGIPGKIISFHDLS